MGCFYHCLEHNEAWDQLQNSKAAKEVWDLSKILVVGLPRTGTTSFCYLMLTLGFRVAHTAYTKESFYQADVIADTPVYSDFEELDKIFPGSKFVFLERDLQEWIPSMAILLKKIEAKLAATPDHFHPLFLTCMRKVFPEINDNFKLAESQLERCYLSHQEKVKRYFSSRPEDLLCLDVSETGVEERIMEFLKTSVKGSQKLEIKEGGNALAMPHLNRAGEITGWNKLKHPNKVDSYAFGEDRRKYFDYFAKS